MLPCARVAARAEGKRGEEARTKETLFGNECGGTRAGLDDIANDSCLFRMKKKDKKQKQKTKR